MKNQSRGLIGVLALVSMTAVVACGDDPEGTSNGDAGGAAGQAGGAATMSTGSGGAGGATTSTGSGGAGGATTSTGSGGAGGATTSTGSGGAGGATTSTGSGGAGGATTSTGSGGAGGATTSTGSGGAGGGLIDLLTPITETVAVVGGTANSVAVDSAGVVHVVYAGKAGSLYYATRGDSDWTSEPIEEGFMPGQVARLAIDASDTPHVLYRDGTTNKLKYARKGAGGWTSMEVAPLVNVNTRLDLALDPSGNPHAVFQNLSGPEHGYAHWTGSEFAAEAIPNSTGVAPSIVVDGAGTVFMTTGGTDAGNLAVGTTGNFAVTPFDSIPGSYDQTDLAIDTSGDLHVVYVRGTSRLYVKRTGSTWGTPAILSNVLNNAQIAVDSNKNPYVVGYAGGGSPLYLGRYESGQWTAYKVALSGNVPSIVIDPQGKIHISYYETVVKEVRYATY